MSLSVEQRARIEVVKAEVDRLMSTAEWTDAILWQYPAYQDRLGFVRDPEGHIVIVSTLRPADACGTWREACVCWLPDGHADPAHVCGCGGSWRPDGSVVCWPGPFAGMEVPEGC